MKFNIKPFSGSTCLLPGLCGIIFQQNKENATKQERDKDSVGADWHIHLYKDYEEISWARMRHIDRAGLFLHLHFSEAAMHETNIKVSFISFIERWARAKGYKGLQLLSRPCGAGFYERLQFKAIGRESIINGLRHLIMKKTL